MKHKTFCASFYLLKNIIKNYRSAHPPLKMDWPIVCEEQCHCQIVVWCITHLGLEADHASSPSMAKQNLNESSKAACRNGDKSIVADLSQAWVNWVYLVFMELSKKFSKLINSKLFLYIDVPLTAKVKSIRTNPRNHKLQEWPQHSWSKYGTSNQVTKSSPDQMLDKQAQTFL